MSFGYQIGSAFADRLQQELNRTKAVLELLRSGRENEQAYIKSLEREIAELDRAIDALKQAEASRKPAA